MKVKFLKEIDKYKPGDCENVTAASAKELIEAGYAAPLLSVEQEAEGGSHTQDEDLQGAIKEAVAEAMKAFAPAQTTTTLVSGDAPPGPYKTLGEFARDLAAASTPQGRPTRKWAEYMKAVGSDEMAESLERIGGALVPTEFRAQLLQKELEAAIVRPRATVIPMASNRIQIPYINETSRASTLHGGINPAKVAEKAQRTGTKPAFGLCELSLNTLYALAYVTNELIQDSAISLGPILEQLYTSTLVYEADEAYIWGTGVGEPLGIMNADCLVTVSAESGQSAGTIVFENIVKMYSRLYPASIRNAVWLANPDTFPQLATMSMAVGTGGVPVYMPANGAAGAPYGTLMGRPLIFTEKCKTVGTTGDIILADFSQYLIGVKAGGAVEATQSVHLRFDYNETAFKFEMRHAGQPWWNAPLTPRQGSNTLSPFVALATRS